MLSAALRPGQAVAHTPRLRAPATCRRNGHGPRNRAGPRPAVIPAEAEVLRARLVDRPTAFSRAQIQQRAAAPGMDGDHPDPLAARAGSSHEDAVLAEDPGDVAAAVSARQALRLASGSSRGRCPRARQAETIHLADDGIAADADLGGDLAAGEPGSDAALELLDALGGPGRAVPRSAFWAMLSRPGSGAMVCFRILAPMLAPRSGWRRSRGC